MQSINMQKNFMNQVKEMDTIFETKLMKINVGEKIGELIQSAKTKRIEVNEQKIQELRLR